MGEQESSWQRRQRRRGLGAIKDLNVYQLASMAGCMSPGEGRTQRRKEWSPGAELLADVLDGVVEAIRNGDVTEDDSNDSGQLYQIADSAIDHRTHVKWMSFVDIGAYREESDDGQWPTDPDAMADAALSQIAIRLCDALVGEWVEARNG